MCYYSSDRGAEAAGLLAVVPAPPPEAAVPTVRQAEQEGVPGVAALGQLRPVYASGSTVKNQKIYSLIMFYKGQSIWDGRRDFGKNKGQSLAFLNCLFMVQGTKMHCLGKRHCKK